MVLNPSTLGPYEQQLRLETAPRLDHCYAEESRIDPVAMMNYAREPHLSIYLTVL